MKKERGIRVVEYGSPTKSSKQGIKTCRGEETVGKAEREQGGFSASEHRGTEDVQKRLAGGRRKKKGEWKQAETIWGLKEQWLAQKVKCDNKKPLCRRKRQGNTGEKQIFVV